MNPQKVRQSDGDTVRHSDSMQAGAGITFAHLGLRMGNGQTYSLLLGLGMGMTNPIPNFWDWEWE